MDRIWFDFLSSSGEIREFHTRSIRLKQQQQQKMKEIEMVLQTTDVSNKELQGKIQ